MNQELLESIKELISEIEKLRDEVKVLRMSNTELKDKIYDLNIVIEDLK